MSYFTSADDPRVVAAREPLYDKAMSRTARKKALRQRWRTDLVIEQNGHMVPVCLTAACKIFVCSRAFLTFSKKRTQAESNSVRAKKNISIAAWMFNYKKNLDIMPAQGWSMLPLVASRVRR
jgi:hypothetical protein